MINLLGGLTLHPARSAFEIVDGLVAEATARTPFVLVDMHGEATSEKVAMGWHLAGRVERRCRHAHARPDQRRARADGGTAYITDLGMTGPHDSVIGVKKEIILRRFLTQLPQRSEPADADVRLEGACWSSTAPARPRDRPVPPQRLSVFWHVPSFFEPKTRSANWKPGIQYARMAQVRSGLVDGSVRLARDRDGFLRLETSRQSANISPCRSSTSSTPRSTTRPTARATGGRAHGSARRSAATQIGACLYELGDGERTYPYHLHHGNEEWVFVVAGTPTCGRPTASARYAPATCSPSPAAPWRTPGERTGHRAAAVREAPARHGRVPRQRQGRRAAPRPSRNFLARDAVGYWEGE